MSANVTTLTERGQTSLPARLRKELGLKPGQKTPLAAAHRPGMPRAHRARRRRSRSPLHAWLRPQNQRRRRPPHRRLDARTPRRRIRMTWVVDTCVVLDVYLGDPLHGKASAENCFQRLLPRRPDRLPGHHRRIEPRFFPANLEQQQEFLHLLRPARRRRMDRGRHPRRPTRPGTGRFNNAAPTGTHQTDPWADILIGRRWCPPPSRPHHPQHAGFSPAFPSLKNTRALTRRRFGASRPCRFSPN